MWTSTFPESAFSRGIHGNCSAHQIRKKVLDNWKTWLGEDWCHPSHKSGAEKAVEVVKKVTVQEKRDLAKEGLENVDKVVEELDKKIEYILKVSTKRLKKTTTD